MMDAREAKQWLSGAYARHIAASPNIKTPIERAEHICTIPRGEFQGMRWVSEGKIIYIEPIIWIEKAS